MGSSIEHRPNRFWVFVGLAGVLGALGCAASSGGRAGEAGVPANFSVEYREDALPVHRVMAMPVTAVWAALPQAFRALGYPGAPSARQDERVFLTPYLAVRELLYEGERNSLYFDCGRSGTAPLVADAWMITFAILVRLTPEGEGRTAVDVILDGNAADRTQRAKSVHCTGTGRLETALLELIERHARAFAP